MSGEAPAGRPIAIAFALDNLGTGGTELNAVRIAERLDAARFTLHLFSLQPDGPLRDRFLQAGAVWHPIPVRNLWGPGSWRAGWRFRTALEQHRIRLLHAHDLYSSAFLVPWARTAVPRVVTIASRRWWYPPSRKLGLLGRLALPFADRLLVNSPALATRAIEEEGARRSRTVVIPNFLDDDAIREPTSAERDHARTALGIEAGATVVGIVARLAPVKDHQTLLRAFELVAARFPRAHLLVVGGGPERERLGALVVELGLAGRVTFAGELPNATNLHSACDLSVLCSRHEGLPNSLVEAMGAARPVVASAVGGNLDAVRHGRTGLLFPVGGVDALAQCLSTLLADPVGRRRMGLAGMEVARSEYSASVVLRDLEALYLGLLAEPRGTIRV